MLKPLMVRVGFELVLGLGFELWLWSVLQAIQCRFRGLHRRDQTRSIGAPLSVTEYRKQLMLGNVSEFRIPSMLGTVSDRCGSDRRISQQLENVSHQSENVPRLRWVVELSGGEGACLV